MTSDPEPAPVGDLAAFIEESLTQIVQGIAGAQLRVDELDAQINPVGELPPAQTSKILVAEGTVAYLQQVDFDIAVTRIEGHSGDVDAGIRVMGIGVGGSTGSTDQRTNVSRIKFSIPVVFPGDPNPTAAEAIQKRHRQLEESRRQPQRGYSSWVTSRRPSTR